MTRYFGGYVRVGGGCAAILANRGGGENLVAVLYIHFAALGLRKNLINSIV